MSVYRTYEGASLSAITIDNITTRDAFSFSMLMSHIFSELTSQQIEEIKKKFPETLQWISQTIRML